MNASVPAATSPTSPTAAAATSIGKWLLRIVVVAVAVTALVGAASYITGASQSTDDGPKITYTVRRGELTVTVTEQGTLESSENTEIKCLVRGGSTVLWVIETGTQVKPGDVLVRLDTSTIEDTINQQKITYQTAIATHTRSESDVAVAKISITEYMEGTFRTELKTLQKDLAIAQSNVRVAKNMMAHAERMFKRGYVSELEVESNQFTVIQADLELELKHTEIDVLERFTKAKMVEDLTSTLKASEAKLKSDKASLELEKSRLERAEKQLEHCVIRAESSGMVIYPSAAEWKETPDIEEGAVVRETQVLLLIPDLTQMQVKVGIHESKVDRLRVDMDAKIELQDETVKGKVSSIATVTKPAGWWTGNVVKYDTIIQLKSRPGLKPGMTAAVEIQLATYTDQLIVPVAAVLALDDKFYCWVKSSTGPSRRLVDLGDSNDQFLVVKSGLDDGEVVYLNPRSFIDEARQESLKPINLPNSSKPEEAVQQAKDYGGSKKPAAAAKNGKQIGNKDDVLTKGEDSDSDQQHTDSTEANGDDDSDGLDTKKLDGEIKSQQAAPNQG
jgi:multidrug efflux pump subunit AcrA (membrane-fusion protein)